MIHPYYCFLIFLVLMDHLLFAYQSQNRKKHRCVKDDIDTVTEKNSIQLQVLV